MIRQMKSRFGYQTFGGTVEIDLDAKNLEISFERGRTYTFEVDAPNGKTLRWQGIVPVIDDERRIATIDLIPLPYD